MSLVSLGKYLEAYEIFPSWANLFFSGLYFTSAAPHEMHKCMENYKYSQDWCDNLFFLTVVNTSYVLHFVKVDIFIVSPVIGRFRGKKLFTPIHR